MKKFTFKGVLDGFRSSVQAAPRGSEQEIQETLRPEHFQLKKTFRHGFPFSPTAIAWDPIQKLLAIGDKAGDLRILGGPGVDAHARHESGEAVVHARFLINEGALVTATADDHIHLWNFRQKSPQIVQSLKFQRERITCLHLPLQSKWLHVGTERGNVHVVHIETFLLSGYVINWNKAIEVTRANHPGSVVAVSDNPLDASKLLIAFESGLVVVWDLRSRAAEWRGCMGTGGPGEGVRAAVWQLDGKQLMTAHADGALATWTTRAPRPLSVIYPHAKASKDGKFEACKPIHSLEWKTAKTGETFVIFSGGLPTDKAGRTHSITVLNGKSTTVLEMEHSVIDFVTLCESPWTAEYQDPYAIVVLLQNDLVVIDLLTPGYPCFENPYPMDIHESPVTCCSYLADCPSDLIPAFYSVGRQGSKKPTGFSEKKWPINGGEWAPASCSYSEIILTGHADGSVKFWDASAGTLQILYKLKSAKVFERRAGWCGEEESPLAVQLVALCAESRRLAVALASNHVVLFKFRKSETTSETHVLDVPYISDTLDEEISPDSEYITGARSGSVSRGGNALDSGEADKRAASSATELRVRGAQGTGGVRKPAGFQAALVCLQQGVGAANIAALTINSSYGLMAWGGERGVVIVDISRRVIVAALGAASLYGTADPWGRAPRPTTATEQQRSPSLDQLEEPATQRTSPLPSSSPGGDTFPTGSLPDEVMPSTEDRTKMEARRKSTTWKGFNLKRQLSKVDLKLKTAFTVAPERKEDIDNEPKSNSQFYSGAETTSPPTEPETEAPTLTGSARDSPETDSENTEAQSDIKELPSESQHVSPAGGSTDVYDRMHKELREIWKEDQEDRRTQVDITPSSSPPETGIDALELTRASRPDNLPLFEEDGRPIRPPRQNKKDKFKKEEDKRDKRLLSVPNIKYSKQDPVLRDLRKKRSTSQVQPTFAGNIIRRFSRIDKLDSSFSRSRSSSMSSLENISSEGIQCLAFADSYTKKSDPTMLLPTLWIGTTLGSVLTMMINLPEADCRYTQPVVISISGGPIFRLKGSILAMSFLDCNGALIPYSYECWRDENKESKDKRERTPTKQGSSSRMSPTLGGSMDSAGGSACSDRQFVVIASEKQARVVALPSQNCVYRQQIADTDFVVKAEIVSLKDSVCLVNYISTGHLVAYSLPSLRPLIDVDFLPLAELRIAKTFCFSNKGHGLYLSSPTELQKFTIDTEFCQSLNEMLGELFLPRDMPEPPKESFLKGLLFGGGSRTLDREELFGEGSGKPNRAIAKHIPGTSQNIENLGQRASTASSEVSRAHQLVLERGDKLSQLEDRTERMHSHAQEFGSSAHQLMLKYKDKKWYQL